MRGKREDILRRLGGLVMAAALVASQLLGALAPIAAKARHLVFEPHSEVKAEQLRAGLAHIRKLWG